MALNTSTYVPTTNAAARGASHTVLDEATGQRIQLVPGAAGYDINKALPYLGEIAVTRGDEQLAQYLKDQGVYDQAAALWDTKYQGLVQQDLNAFRDLAASRGISLPSNLGEEHLGMYQNLLDMVDLEKQSGGGGNSAPASTPVETDLSDSVTLNPSGINRRGITTGGAIGSNGIVSNVLTDNNQTSLSGSVSGMVYGPDGTEYASSQDAITAGVFNYLYFPPSSTSSAPTTRKLTSFNFGGRGG